MVTAQLFTALVVLVACQRLLEVRHSRRNEVRLKAAGAREHVRWQSAMLAVLHGAWLISMCVEVWSGRTVFRPMTAAIALGCFGIGQMLRLVAMRTLGPRWTIRVMTIPGAPPVVAGIYRYLRHPNYLGVVLEIAALPMVHGAVVTAVTFTLLNALALILRIRAEETALAADNAYLDHFSARPRFVPTGRAGDHHT